MAQVFFGVGSNLNPEKNIPIAIAEFRRFFGKIRVSPVYQNKAFGFKGKDFLNLIVACDTEKEISKLQNFIEDVHALSGRKRGSHKFLSRTLDVDLLIYDSLILDEKRIKIPRDDILRYSFVLKPLADIAPDLIHPITNRPVIDHWRSMDKTQHPLTLINMDLS